MKRIVIKVGSHVLTEEGEIALERMRALVDLIADLIRGGREVILVSSGAVAAGYTQLRLDRSDVAQKQALAAIGQPYLLKLYQSKFAHHGILSAQLLLSADDFDSRRRTRHARNAVEELLKHRVVPIVNENDVVATEELVFGDNDRLSAHVAHYFDADLLVILSDIDGYYDKDPHRYPDARLRKVVCALDAKELEAECTPHNAFATGGIVTKLQAADFLLKRGGRMFLASGFDLADVQSLLLEGVHRGGTLFESSDARRGEEDE
ncbi:glutamate 5-kinase [Nitratifractor salsuginis]|uniref:Glutamate 5-kinase n=1 Tax=Nitratifractor salsuginis (strain DSM 16511 / JCM 12458 / E9I37-1) TaxID=749222 RepID=E6X0B8_NITSE|nr:glutamate 5-kinase [Nitratifractor salsuginis]ADV45707.1 glutamate 5-kinase [Nitratifractor salsuginis DSM 16511]